MDTDTNVRVFTELPPIRNMRGVRRDWAKAKADMIANEGLWVLIAERVSNSTPQQLRTGKYKDFRIEELEHFEFSVRKPDNPEKPYGPRRTDLYGRYTR